MRGHARSSRLARVFASNARTSAASCSAFRMMTARTVPTAGRCGGVPPANAEKTTGHAAVSAGRSGSGSTPQQACPRRIRHAGRDHSHFHGSDNPFAGLHQDLESNAVDGCIGRRPDIDQVYLGGSLDRQIRHYAEEIERLGFFNQPVGNPAAARFFTLHMDPENVGWIGLNCQPVENSRPARDGDMKRCKAVSDERR